MRIKRAFLGCLLWSAMAFSAEAVPITYTATTYADGSLDGRPFTDQLVTVTGLADTYAIEATPISFPFFRYTNRLSSLTVAVSDVGSDQVLSPGTVFSAAYVAGFTPSVDLLDIENTEFQTYNLSTSIGPIVGSVSAFGNPGESFATELGSFSITAFDSNGTFQATADTTIPEPDSLILLSESLVIFVIMMLCGFGRRPQH